MQSNGKTSFLRPHRQTAGDCLHLFSSEARYVQMRTRRLTRGYNLRREWSRHNSSRKELAAKKVVVHRLSPHRAIQLPVLP
jgi:hypothetical protein